MSNAKFDPTIVKVMWGPYMLTGFEAGAYITATMNSVQRYTRKSSFGRSVHTQVTDLGGSVTMRFQADSPALIVLSTQMVIDQQPGGNVILPLMIKDNNGLDVVTSPLARCVSTPVLEFNDGDQGPREFEFWCEPLVIFHGGISYLNG